MKFIDYLNEEKKIKIRCQGDKCRGDKTLHTVKQVSHYTKLYTCIKCGKEDSRRTAHEE